MDEVLSFKRGRVPLLISMPHPGTRLTPAVDAGLVEEARALTDTDWHIPRLYDFAEELGASTLAAHYSRYVVDLNRPSDDKPLYSTATTGLYPDTLFDGRPLYREGMAPSAEERMRYLAEVWTPYHRTIAEELARLKAEFGYALLWDAHSIRSHVPHLFDGRLPDFNLGTNAGASCDPALAARLRRSALPPKATAMCSTALQGRPHHPPLRPAGAARPCRPAGAGAVHLHGRAGPVRLPRGPRRSDPRGHPRTAGKPRLGARALRLRRSRRRTPGPSWRT